MWTPSPSVRGGGGGAGQVRRAPPGWDCASWDTIGSTLQNADMIRSAKLLCHLTLLQRIPVELTLYHCSDCSKDPAMVVFSPALRPQGTTRRRGWSLSPTPGPPSSSPARVRGGHALSFACVRCPWRIPEGGGEEISYRKFLLPPPGEWLNQRAARPLFTNPPQPARRIPAPDPPFPLQRCSTTWHSKWGAR